MDFLIDVISNSTGELLAVSILSALLYFKKTSLKQIKYLTTI
jgi:hypothetical protein